MSGRLFVPGELKLSERMHAKEDEPGLLAGPETQRRPSLGEALADLRRLCAEEGYTLDIPPRLNRDSEFDPFS
jgi:hypothetical protein